MWQRTVVEAVLRHRWIVLASIALLTAIALVGASKARFEASIEIWFLDGDPTLVSYREFKERFGADRIGLVALLADDVFEPRVLERVASLSEVLEGAPHVSRVLSLTNARIAAEIEDGVEIVDLVSEIPRTPEAIAALRARAVGHSLLVGSLVSPDARATAIVVELTPEGNKPAGQHAFVVAAQAAIEATRTDGVEILFAGSPLLAETMIEKSQADFARLGPLGLVLVLLVSFLVFRRWSAALIPVPVVVISAIWTIGVAGATGTALTVITPMLVMLIVAVGVADTIHVLADYYRHLMDGESPDGAVRESVAHLLLPCFYTSATTVGGLLSLRVSSLAPLAEFGTLAAVGVAFAFVLSVTLVPVILHLAKVPDPGFVERQRTGPFGRLLERLGRPSLGASRIVLVVAGLLAVACAIQASRVEVMANPMNFFKKTDPMRVATERIDEAIGGTTSVEFLITGAEGAFTDPELLGRLDAFERWMEARPGITRTLSVVDLLKDLDRVMRAEDEGRVPDSRALAAQYALMLEGEENFDRVVQSNYSVGRLTARANLSDANVVIEQLDEIETEMGTRFADDLARIEPTGFIRLVTKMDVYLIRSQVQSFLIAIGVITAMMMFLLRSAKLGLFSMIPNVLPIVFGIAFMTTTGIALDQGTVMIPSIALGLVVDDSVHFLYRYRSYMAAGLEAPEAIQRTMRETGRPIVVTSVLLAVAFLSLAIGSFNPAVFFGLISAVVISTALLATLLVLPAALRVLQPKV